MPGMFDIDWTYARKQLKDYADKPRVLDTPGLAERVKEWQDSKHVRDGFQLGDELRIKDPLGPVKYDLPDEVLRSYARSIGVEQRLGEIESYLENGEGKPFVRRERRPEVGQDVFGQLLDEVKLLHEKVGQLEAALSERG